METLVNFLATAQPDNVPDSGATGLLLGLAVIGLGAVARFVKTRKK